MKSMLASLAALLMCLTPASIAGGQPPAEPDRMVPLFNGENLSGWDGNDKLWSVKDGVIRGETSVSRPCRQNTFLIFEGDDFDDFQLRFEFRSSVANNSGVQYRSARFVDDDDEGNANQWRVKGYQFEIRNSHNIPDVAGFLFDEGGKRARLCLVGEKAGWVDGEKTVRDELLSDRDYKSLFRLDNWNDAIIIAQGNRMQHYLNGRLILDFTDDADLALRKGIIALQLHSGPPMWAEFRNIRIHELE